MYDEYMINTITPEELDKRMEQWGMLPCRGQALNKNTYQGLFQAIGRSHRAQPIEIDQAEIMDGCLKLIFPRSSKGDIVAHDGTDYKFDGVKWSEITGPLDMSRECECGKEKHGFAAHMQFCPRYERY